LSEPYRAECDGWFTARVMTCGELDRAIQNAEACGNKYAASPLAQKLHESIETLYGA